MEQKQNMPVVWLDPGHDSQWDNPSPVIAGYYEGRQMWKLAQLLAAQLKQYGVLARLTKERENQAVALVKRGTLSAGSDLLISLHSNAAATDKPDWVLVLHQVDDGGGVHGRSREFAKMIGPVIAEAMGLPWQTAGVVSSSDRNANGKADDYYGVLRGAQTVKTPAVIIEHGFHTHGPTAQWLLEDANLQRLAQAEAAAIASWLGVKEQWYRVRKSWGDAASQIGAYRVRENAIAACPPGYSVYDESGTAIHTTHASYDLKTFVQEIQAAIGADVDGIAGPQTISLTPTVSAKVNAQHGVIAPLQKRLYALGYTQVGEADGIAGPMFMAAVVAYQTDHSCYPDGELTAGNRTWKSILGML